MGSDSPELTVIKHLNFRVKRAMSREKKNTLLIQGSILAGAGLITKLIGFLYRIPMSNMLGEEGNGIYSIAFSIYNVVLTLSSYSLPLAVSKLVSARIAKGEYKNARRVFKDALIFALVAGTVAMLVLLVGADFFEKLYKCDGLAKPLRVLAPTTFIVALLGAFRGFFQGHSTMVPTAVSQIAEQVINAGVSIAATYGFMKMYASSDIVSAYGAAGGTLGTLCGAAIALIYFLILFAFTRGTLEDGKEKEDKSRDISDRMVFKQLFYTIIPVIISQTIYQVGYTLDSLIFNNIMAWKGQDKTVTTSLQGVYNTQYNQLINLPVAIATAMASSTLPGIVSSRVKGETEGVREKITSVIKVNMVIAFPAAAGFSALAEPIMRFLFPSLVTYRAAAANLLMYGSAAIVFYALSTITTSILQGNDQMKIPVIHCAVSLALHIVLIVVLLFATDLGVYALVIGNVTFPLVVSLLNCRSISKNLGYKWEIKRTFLMPFVCCLVMAAFTLISYKLTYMLSSNLYISTIVSIAISVVVYFAAIIKSPCFDRDEIKSLPFGTKLVRFK